MVRKKIQQIGSSYGIIIPKIFFEDMGVNPILDDVELEIRDKILHVKKAEKKKD
ncbi:hypothetical protein J6E39_05670 [bacterium]|nr:hypothetical protein [bacterium]